jgi:glutamyl-tRNA reductase
MNEADIVVSSTGCPVTILCREEMEAVMRARRHRPLFLIDIAVPRDIDPDVQFLENVYLYNIDHLETLAGENLRQREQEVARCRAVIHQRTTALVARLNKKWEANAKPCGAAGEEGTLAWLRSMKNSNGNMESPR